MPDSPASRSAVKQALAAQPVSYLRVVSDDDTSSNTSEIVVELPQDSGLTSVLSALHAISPQVFVSRADKAEITPERDGRAPEALAGGA